MTGKGALGQKAHQNLKIILTTQVIWLAFVLLIGAWWASVLLDQAGRIAELEKLTGISTEMSQFHWMRTQRMLFWEGLTFFILLIGSTGLLFGLYWREVKRSRSIQAFFASLTHELRTPLTSIRLQAETISEMVKDPQASPFIKRLLEDTQRLESQVDRTLELARVEGGGSLYLQPLRMKPTIERIISAWKDSHSYPLDVSLTLTDDMIESDPAAIQVILRNLLENSIRHGKKDSLQVKIESRQSGPWTVVQYQDDGFGFQGNPQKLGQLFQKGAHSQGAGVGLYLVKALMERMGGKAQFQGQKGFEAELWFRGGVA